MRQSIALSLALMLVSVSASAQALADQPMISETAPNIELPTVQGETRSFEEFRGKYVILHFGTSW